MPGRQETVETVCRLQAFEPAHWGGDVGQEFGHGDAAVRKRADADEYEYGR